MRWLTRGVVWLLLLGCVPTAAHAAVLQPTGVPLRSYVVILQRSFPTVLTLCTPLACPEHPVFTIGPIDPANCTIPSFATAEDAQQYVLQNAPFSGPWYTVQAIDAAHAYATVLLGPVLGNAPNAVPPALVPDAEEQVAQAFTDLCGPDPLTSTASA